MGLYGVLTLSRGVWGCRLLVTMFFIRFTLAIAEEGRCEESDFCWIPNLCPYIRRRINHSNPNVLRLFVTKQPGVMGPGLASKRGNQRQLLQNPIGISVLGMDQSRIHLSEMWNVCQVMGGSLIDSKWHLISCKMLKIALGLGVNPWWSCQMGGGPKVEVEKV